MSEETPELSTYEQMQAIREQIAREEPYISEKQALENLAEEIKNSNPTQYQQLQHVQRVYPYLRRVRRDGDCFYRAFLLGLFEWSSKQENQEAAKRLKERLAAAVERLGKYHAPMIVADFWEMFEELLNWTIEEHPQTSELIERLSDRGTACYVITFARLLTSLYLRENAETLIHFLPDGAGDMHTFVTQNVEPLGQEADHVQVVALAQQTELNLKVIYLDRQSHEDSSFSFEFIHADPTTSSDAQSSTDVITLLYRPGHYDILYTA